jgi:hypothetical protein
MDSNSIGERCRQEIIRLHRFFVNWYHGQLSPSDDAWSVLPDALAPSFELISPGGRVMTREPLLVELRRMHASRDPARGFRIWIQNFDCRYVGDDVIVATYEEWQHLDGEDRGRLSTVAFERKRDSSQELLWLHVHETWLPTDGSST